MAINIIIVNTTVSKILCTKKNTTALQKAKTAEIHIPKKDTFLGKSTINASSSTVIIGNTYIKNDDSMINNVSIAVTPFILVQYPNR